MATLEYLDDERTKLWAEVTALKQKIDDAVVKLSQVDKASAETVQTRLSSLDAKIGEVRRLAESKTPEDVQTASRAAQTAVKMKDDVAKLATDTQAAHERLEAAKRGLEKIQKSGETASAIRAELESVQQQVAAIKKGVETDAAELKVVVEKCEEYKTNLGASSQAATADAQKVATLNKQAEDASSTLEASKKSFGSLKDEMEEMKSEFDAAVSKSKEKFESLLAEKTKSLNELTAEIEKLLPPASTASISKSFEDRKTAVLKGKWVWTALLIASVVAIVVFGCISLWCSIPNDGPMKMFTRFVVIAGLVILEEFARRNYSAVFRLSEAYAYKEAICKSLVGFKKELGSIPLPRKDGEGEGEQASAELAATFLAKLGDEPAGKVFEKNRPVFGLLQAFMRMVNPPGGEEIKPETVLSIANGLGRFSWQIVTAIGIVSASVLAAIAMIVR